MRSAFDLRSMLGARRKFPHPRRYLFGAMLCVMLLASCRMPEEAAATATQAATFAPRLNLTPTIAIISSDELYGEDSRAIGETSPRLASLPAGAVLPPERVGDSERAVTILLDATTSIDGELYQADGLRQPGVLLLGEDLRTWGNFPRRLSQSGYVALVLQTDATTQARQVETMLQSLIVLPSVDPGVIGVVGAGRAADLALLGCAVNSLCDALALLSPLSRDTLLNILPSYGLRPLWLAAGDNDAEARNTAAALAEAAQGEAMTVLATEGRGADMLQFQPALQDELIVWLQSQLATR